MAEHRNTAFRCFAPDHSATKQWHQALRPDDCMAAEGLEATVDGDEQDVAERHDPFAEEEEDEEVTTNSLHWTLGQSKGSSHAYDEWLHDFNVAAGQNVLMVQGWLQEQERRVKDVAYNLKERIRQELAFPAVIHFYTWLLQGKCCHFASL